MGTLNQQKTGWGYATAPRCASHCRPGFKQFSSDSQKVGKRSLNIYDALKCRLVGLTVF